MSIAGDPMTANKRGLQHSIYYCHTSLIGCFNHHSMLVVYVYLKKNKLRLCSVWNPDKN